MQLVIAEKPNVAQSIAAVLGANKKESGYLIGAGYIVSWCVGHLVELGMPHLYDERYSKWQWDDLPILPETWQYMICDATRKQFNILRSLMNDARVDVIVCATDAGREGELIFRLVYHQCGCTKPIKRLWISSLEESAIRSGFLALRDGHDFDRLYQAALCRAQADWLVGINATRLFSLMYGTTLNVGRVMSPTLALIVSREAAIMGFQAEPFYSVQISCGFLAHTERMADKAEAERIQQLCNLQTAVVQSIETKQKSEKPPKLYDLTTLQRDANRLFGYSAQQTLDYAQSLYEKKLLSYPRTDSRHLTSEMEQMVTQLAPAVATVFPYTAGLNLPVNTAQVIDDTKVSDHHAIIPTQSMVYGNLASLSIGEADILQLVCVRLLCAVGKLHTWEETAVKLTCKGIPFTAKGKTVKQMGWRIPETTYQGSIGGRINKELTEREYGIPELKKGQELGPVVATLKEGKTTPPKHYTEDSLLAAMESAGAQDAPEDAERKGLGTPATRAGVLEKLISTGFVVRKGDKRTKHLMPTPKGVALITILPEQLQSPLLTAEWEQRLKRIEHGEESPDAFMQDIRTMLADLKTTAKPIKGAATLFPTPKESVGACPHCSRPVAESDKGFFCTNQGCRFAIWKDNKFLTGQQISVNRQLLLPLLKDNRVKLHNLRSKRTGKPYSATLVIACQDDGSPRFQFEFEGKHSGGDAHE